MRFTAEKSQMLPAIETAFKFAEKSENIPILAHMLIVAKDNEVSITASNLDRVCRTSFPAAVTEPGEICLPAAKLTMSVKQSAGSEVSIRTEGDQVIMNTGRAVFKMGYMTREGFPDAGMLTQDGVTFAVDASLLARIEKEVAFACWTEKVRDYLKGVFWHQQGDELNLVATDGHRMSKLVVPSPSNNIPAVIVPSIDLPAWTGEVEVTISEFFIRYRQERCVVASKLIEGNFPDYPRVIPQDYRLSVIVDRADLLASIGRVSAYDRGKSGAAILFSAMNGELTLSTRSNADEADDAIACSGDDVESVILNQHIIGDALSSFECDTVELHVIDGGTAVKIVSPTDEFRLCLAVPMRDVRAMFNRVA